MGVLVVSLDDLGRRLGFPLPLDGIVAWQLEQAVQDAQADVEAYLGRSLAPETFTEFGLWLWPDGWHLENEPVVEIVSETPEEYPDGGTTGRWTVVYRAGLDVAADAALAPIRRYVMAHAAAAPAIRDLRYASLPEAGRRAASVSAEGQSISYDYDVREAPEPGSGWPGALPSRSSLDRWRLAGRRIVQGEPDPWASAPWPYDRPVPGGWWPRGGWRW